MDGDFLFRLTGLPDEWMLKSVTVGNRDVTDTPVRIAPGGTHLEGLQIVLSRSGARLNGDVVDSSGTPSTDATVIVFADERARWGIGSRFIRTVRPDNRGRFSLGGLPPGAYRVVAQDQVVDGQWEDPEFLEGLLKKASRVELAEGSSETIKLTLELER